MSTYHSCRKCPKRWTEEELSPPLSYKVIQFSQADIKQLKFKIPLTCVPTVMLGIEEMPALDFGFLFLALAFSSIFFRWLKGTTPLQTDASSQVSKLHWHSYLSLTYTVTLYWLRNPFVILAKCQVLKKSHIACYRKQLQLNLQMLLLKTKNYNPIQCSFMGGKKKRFFFSPPVEAILQLCTRVECTAVQWHHTFPLQLRESLSTVLQLRGHCAQRVVHPGCHLYHTHTQITVNDQFIK